MNLYELGETWKQIEGMLYEEDIDEKCILDTLESIEGEIEDKADGYAKLIKGLMATSNMKKEEAKKLTLNASKEEERARFLKNRLEEIMKITGKTKFKTDLFSFNIQTNGGKQAMTIDGEVPEEFCKMEADNEKIRKALENGENLPFAHLEPRGESLRIR